MTVGELIEKLKTFDASLPVETPQWDEEWGNADTVELYSGQDGNGKRVRIV